MKDMIYFTWEKAQYLETIFSDKNAISISSLNGQFNQLISRQNQLNTMKNDLITKRKLLQDRYYAYRRELQEQINHNSNENSFDSKKGLKKEEKLLKNKIRNKERNQNQNQNQNQIQIQIQEYNKALIQKEFIKYRKYRFNNYVSFSILKNKNENKNEIDNRNENENDYKINVKEKVLKLENQLYRLEEEQKSLNEKKVIKYNKFLKSQLKSKFELKIKRKNLRDKLKQLQLERSELDEKLKEATSESKMMIKRQQKKLKDLQVELKEQIQQLISEKKQQRNKRKDILNQFIIQKELLRKLQITYTLYDYYINSIDKKLIEEVQKEDDERKEDDKKIEKEGEEEIKSKKIKSENKLNVVVQTERVYSMHAIIRMKQRNITVAMIENAIKKGEKKLSHDSWSYVDPISQVIVIVKKDSGIVITQW